MQVTSPIILPTTGSKLAVFGDQNGTPFFSIEIVSVTEQFGGLRFVEPSRAFYSRELDKSWLTVPTSETESVQIPLGEALIYALTPLAELVDNDSGKILPVFRLDQGLGREPKMELLPFMFNEHRDLFFSTIDYVRYHALPEMVRAINKALAVYVLEENTDAA